jgi:hypothetical protein
MTEQPLLLKMVAMAWLPNEGKDMPGMIVNVKVRNLKRPSLPGTVQFRADEYLV